MIKQSEVLILGDPRLKKIASEVDDPTTCAELVLRMKRVMSEYEGVGLAATQIGEMVRVFVYKVGETEGAVINPVIAKGDETELGTEGCLSIPGMIGEVKRALSVTLEGFDDKGEQIKIKASGMLARVFQHEYDHLDGILFLDRAEAGTLKPVPLNQVVRI